MAGTFQQAPSRASLTSLIDNKAPNGNTIAAFFITLASSASTTFSGRPVCFLLNTSAFSTSVGTGLEFAIQIDAGPDNVVSTFFFDAANTHHSISGMVILTPTAGSHTVNFRFRRSVGGGTITLDGSDHLLLYAIES